MNVIYEDKHILVVNKSAGIAVQSAGVGTKDLETEIKKYRKLKGESPEIYVVHRLDQPVSGLIVFAKTKEAAAKMSKGMQEDGYIKDYRADVYSVGLIKEKATLTDYLIKDSKTNTAQVVEDKTPGAKKAILEYELLEKRDKESTLLIHLHTGRFHQIRVQLANRGMPILGDRKYGTEDSMDYSNKSGIKNTMLTACRLSFVHPDSGKKMDFEL